jgi:hypothetical protein
MMRPFFVIGVHQDRFAVVVEGIARCEVRNSAFLQFTFEQANRRQLRIGEHHVEQERIVDRFQLLHASGVTGGELALLNRNMDNLHRSRAITRGVDVRRTRLLPAVDDNLAMGARRDAGGGEIQ